MICPFLKRIVPFPFRKVKILPKIGDPLKRRFEPWRSNVSTNLKFQSRHNNVIPVEWCRKFYLIIHAVY